MRHCRAGAINRPPQFRSPPYQLGRVHHQGPDAKSDPDGLGNGEHGNQHSANLRSCVSPRYRDQTLSIPWHAGREGAPPSGREPSAGGSDASAAIDRVLQALVACLSSDHEAELAAASGRRGRDMCRASSDGSWDHHVARLAALPGFSCAAASSARSSSGRRCAGERTRRPCLNSLRCTGERGEHARVIKSLADEMIGRDRAREPVAFSLTSEQRPRRNTPARARRFPGPVSTSDKVK